MIIEALHNPGKYWLPEHVCACSRLEGTVLLDLHQGQYFALSNLASAVVSTRVSNWPSLPQPALYLKLDVDARKSTRCIEALVKAGLITTAKPLSQRGLITITPTSSLGQDLEECTSIRGTHIVRFISAYVWARASIWLFSLDRTVREVATTKEKTNSTNSLACDLELISLVTTFRTLRPYAFTAKDRCLVHSLALIRFLSYYGVFPTWFIGIKLRPWSAHSWVQLGNTVLDSTPEKICAFTPILSV